MHENFFKIARTNMVKNQILTNSVKNSILIEALYKIEKENFIPKSLHDMTYSDSDINFSKDRDLLRTFILAKMIDSCDFKRRFCSSNWVFKWLFTRYSIKPSELCLWH